MNVLKNTAAATLPAVLKQLQQVCNMSVLFMKYIADVVLQSMEV